MPRSKKTLDETHPALAAEWHPTKNGDLTPEQVTYGSTKNVWWRKKCVAGEPAHEWQATLNNRSRGRSCSVCSGHTVQVGVNDLATVSPELASEWHPTHNGELTPKELSGNSGRRVWWRKKCVAGEPAHEWQATVDNRSNGSGCSVCSGHTVQVGVNDLATVSPELASEWHPTNNGDLTPENVTVGSGRRVWWQRKCVAGEPAHEWQATISSRSSGSGCSVCRGFTVQVGVNDLATVSSELASEWHPTHNGGLTPEAIAAGSSKKVWWRKKCVAGEPAHEWQATISNRSNGTDCPVCRGLTVQVGVNDLATVSPELASEWHPTHNGDLTPEAITVGSNKEVWWRKKCVAGEPAHEWQAQISSRSSGSGCSVCSGHTVQIGVNDLATVSPELASEWHPTNNGDLTPENVAIASHKKVWWQRKCVAGEPAHEWQARVADRSRGRDCAVCAAKQIQVGVNDLATVSPELASEWHPTNNGDLTPENVTVGSGRRVWWQRKCVAGEPAHEWQAMISNRSKGKGCPECADYGFDGSKDGWFYLVRHPKWKMYQVGISNVPEVRLGTHRRNGWEEVGVIGPMPGNDAADLERRALRAIEDRGGELAVLTSKGPFDGYTESWPIKSLRVRTFDQLLGWAQSAST